jgi:hypothetical protein
MPYTPKNGKTPKPKKTAKDLWRLTGVGRTVTAFQELGEENRTRNKKEAQEAADKKAGIKRKRPMGKKKKPSKTYHYEYK